MSIPGPAKYHLKITNSSHFTAPGPDATDVLSPFCGGFMVDFIISVLVGEMGKRAGIRNPSGGDGRTDGRAGLRIWQERWLNLEISRRDYGAGEGWPSEPGRPWYWRVLVMDPLCWLNKETNIYINKLINTRDN